VKRKKLLLGIFTLLLFTVGGTAAWLKVRSLETGHHLTVAWEGLWLSPNFRDAGASFNQCLGTPLMREGILLRANRWFSGFSCARVGSPEEIFSLNYKPETGEEFFCQADGHKVIGRHYNSQVMLYDLEFPETWSNEAMRHDACRVMEELVGSVAAGKSTLIHCDAGQDRTGTVAALLQALVAEDSGIPVEKWIAAIECDYVKSPKLGAAKYGRQGAFISALREHSSIAGFLQETCGISARMIAAAVKELTKEEEL
jgi:hypothetical protein